MNKATQEHETKWTPGPWGVGDLSKSPFNPPTSVWDTKRVLIASTGGYSDNSRGDDLRQEQEANAHLIAAAPRLYEGLSHAAKRFHTFSIGGNHDGDFAGCPNHHCQEWYTALAEARGEMAS